MSHKVSPYDSALLQAVEEAKEDIQHRISTTRTKIDMQSELKDQLVDDIKAVFDDMHATLTTRETKLIETAQEEYEESVKCQNEFLKHSGDIVESVNQLYSEIKHALPIKDEITVNTYRRKLEAVQKQFNRSSEKVFEPVFAADDRERKIVLGLRIGKIERKTLEEGYRNKDWADLKPELKVTDTGIFSLHKGEADLKESIISSLVWANGRLVVTDKSNRKLKIFTEEGEILHNIVFSNAEPYCVALVDSANYVDKFAITFPKTKYVYFVNSSLAEISKPPWVSFYMETEVGYSGVARGPHPNTIFGTVVSNSGEPRIDVVDFSKKILKTFKLDPYGQPLFSFPRYILVNANTIIVSDHIMNAVIFLDLKGQLLGRYTGFEGQPLIKPFDIAFDGLNNVYVLDGKTGHIHVIDSKFRVVTIIKCGRTLLNPRLLEYDLTTNRLAIIYAGGTLSIYPVKSECTIEEFEIDDPAQLTGHAFGPLSPGDISPRDKRRSAGSEGFLLLPEGGDRAPSPGF